MSPRTFGGISFCYHGQPVDRSTSQLHVIQVHSAVVTWKDAKQRGKKLMSIEFKCLVRTFRNCEGYLKHLWILLQRNRVLPSTDWLPGGNPAERRKYIKAWISTSDFCMKLWNIYSICRDLKLQGYLKVSSVQSSSEMFPDLH